MSVLKHLFENNRAWADRIRSEDPEFFQKLSRQQSPGYPNDPQVAFEAVFKKDASPEERHQWLEALKKADTGNSLPNYLLALDYFKSGQIDQAVQELVAVSGKQQFQDYTLDRMQDDEEAYLAAGYSVAEARTIPVSLPQLRQVKDLG